MEIFQNFWCFWGSLASLCVSFRLQLGSTSRSVFFVSSILVYTRTWHSVAHLRSHPSVHQPIHQINHLLHTFMVETGFCSFHHHYLYCAFISAIQKWPVIILPIDQITWLPINNLLIQFTYRVFQYFWQFRLFWWMTNPALGRQHPKTLTHPFLVVGTCGGPESRFPEKLVSLWTAESRGENSIGFCQIWKTRRGPFRTRFSTSHVPMSSTVEYVWIMPSFCWWLTHSAGKL